MYRLHTPPFELPSPFGRARDSPCALVIKPTAGDFLSDYENGDNLHIAVTDSHGNVVEYDETGMHCDLTASAWRRCLCIAIATEASADPDWPEYWDWCLHAFVKGNRGDWSRDGYDEHVQNCFHFVLAFLQSLRQDGIVANDKVSFCQNYILPKTRSASRYIKLYRKLQSTASWVCRPLPTEAGRTSALDYG